MKRPDMTYVLWGVSQRHRFHSGAGAHLQVIMRYTRTILVRHVPRWASRGCMDDSSPDKAGSADEQEEGLCVLL